ncbi:MAG TPA: alpha-glucosidase [Candidatus Scatosoma pullicola]|nr:alpha-glucosidase [Candidatus Scatosoma pullicola]
MAQKRENIHKYLFGHPFRTDSVVADIPVSAGEAPYLLRSQDETGEVFRYALSEEDRVYGLGEQVRGIDKRGWVYASWNMDDPEIHENRQSLYASHNFLVVDGKEKFGVFVDSPGKVVYDIDYTTRGEMAIFCGRDFGLYIIEGESVLDVIRTFRKMIGRSYIPPKFAFGFAQSRWGYMNETDVREVADEYGKCGFPVDMIVLDIDYMENYKDFTINGERFPDFPAFVREMKARGIRLIPIIDAAVKAEDGYSVYEEGCKGGYFCKDKDGKPFIVGVWPGDSALPDFLSPEARAWFGEKYRVLLDCGIEGFWNDMNEPSLFYSKDSLARTIRGIAEKEGKNLSLTEFWSITGSVARLANNADDYASFYHETEGGKVSHKEVHNLYGYNMVRAASEYFGKYDKDKRTLIYSRSSHIGMHRYGGIWTGDNASRWDHLLLNLKMLPSLNMCGFLYVGADIGGFGQDTTEDLLLRWTALGAFVPLMRNHCTFGSRRQEYYRFGNRQAFKNLLDMRYSLVPYLYSEFVKSALRDELMYTPLGFLYPDDERAKETEDQMFVGGSIMIAPVYRQNTRGRNVYLPEDMKMVRMRSVSDYTEEILPKGDHYVEMGFGEVVFFVAKGKAIPLAKPAKNVAALDEEHLLWIKYADGKTTYELYDDDGFTTDVREENIRTVTV